MPSLPADPARVQSELAPAPPELLPLPEWLDRGGRGADEPPEDESWHPDEWAPDCHPPTGEDDRWARETDPLDGGMAEGDDPTALELWTEDEADYREPGPDADAWREYEAWSAAVDAAGRDESINPAAARVQRRS